MKFNKFIFVLGIATLMFAAPVARAQVNGLYIPAAFSGGNITVPATSTNVVYVNQLTNGVANGVISTNTYGLSGTSSNITLNTSEYDYAGLTWAFNGVSTSTNTLQIFKSFDFGATFETVPSFSYSSIAPGAARWATNASLDIHGVTTLAFVLSNIGAAASTNHLVEINLKAIRSQIQPAGIGNGKSPGTPIVVPNGAN